MAYSTKQSIAERLLNSDITAPFSGSGPARIAFFVYLCALFGHQTGAGFDALFVRASFAMFVFLALITTVPREVRAGRSGRLLTPFLVWVLTLWGWAHVSVFWASSPSFVFYRAYINNLIQIVVIVPLILLDIRSRDDVLLYLKMILWANLYSELRLYIHTPAGAWGTERVGDAIGVQFNRLGMRTAIASFIAIYLFHETRNPFYVVLAVPSAIVALFTGSRKAFLILILATTLFLVFVNRGFKAFRNLLIVIALLVAAYTVVMTNQNLYFILGRRLENLSSFFLGEGTTEHSTLERQFYREYARWMWEQSPFIGWGFNQFAAQMQAIGYSHVAYCHCNYWELLSCLGIVGFLIYYGWYSFIGWRLIKAGPRQDALALFALVLLVVMTIMEYGFVAFVNIDEYLYLIIAYSVARVLAPRRVGPSRLGRTDNDRSLGHVGRRFSYRSH